MHRTALACVVAACSSKPDVPKDAARSRDAAVRADAAVVAVVPDARVDPVLACTTGPHRLMGKITIAVDPTTLRGELVMFDASKAPSRHVRIRAKPTPDETVFVFDAYATDDSTFKGKHVPRTDHLAPDEVVARIVRTNVELHLVFDGAFRPTPDFDRGTWTDGYSCK